MTTFNVGDRVRIVRSYFTEDPSRMAGGTGTVVKTYDSGYGVDLRVDNDPGDYGEDMKWTFSIDFLEKIETSEVKVGDRVRIVETYFSLAGDEGYPNLVGATGTAISVFHDTVRLRLDHPTDGWDQITVPKVEKIDEDVEPEQVTYEEFREIVLVDGLKAAFDRFNITHK